ncbi:MAG: DEAD/DEAH box helicase [Bacteroidota bacterium]
MVKKGVPQEEITHLSELKYEETELHAKLKHNLKEKGFEFASKIQAQSLAPLQDGRNLIGIANTGTGKTAAFLLPIIERLIQQPQGQLALVVVPTRELALQVDEEFRKLARGLKLRSAAFIGGTNVNTDLQTLKRRNHLIIGTPGRLKDLADRKALQLQRTPILVLDEFDRMLDMGFVQDIRRITREMATRKQTILFSATQDASQKNIIDQLVKNPVRVKINTGYTTSDHIDQDIIEVPEGGNKFKMLLELIDNPGFDRVLVFTETKRWADSVAKKLNKAGISADQIHGNKSQNYRVKALEKFKQGKIRVMVATDVAARGIDVNDITHVINYQLPMSYDTYVHRIGRTGRAGKLGKAFTFVN